MKKRGRRSQRSVNRVRGRQGPKPRLVKGRKNGFVHVASPATASQIERALGITKAQKANVLRAFGASGVKL